MAQEVRADPDTLIELATATLTAADRLGLHYRAQFRALPLPDTAFGTVRPAADASEVAERLLADAHDALAGLVAVLEGDADRLLRTAFAYREADREADTRVGGSRRAGL